MKRENGEVPIRIHSQGNLPLYLQIKYQLSYLISTERLASGTRLPPVRTLAADLDINPHTVAQAYRELQNDGLIESYPGRGSFVREFGDEARAEAARQARLSGVLQDARRRARALGFSDEEISRHLSSLSGQETVPCHVVFVDRAPHIAAKYARRLEHHLGGAVRATALAFEAIERRDAAAVRVLEEAYFVLAFARNMPSLERALSGFGHAYRLLTIVSEVVPETRAALAKLPADTHAVLLSEERYIHSSLNLVALHSSLDTRKVPAFTGAEVDAFREAAAKADLILYTFGLATVLREADPGKPVLELVFDIGPDSVEKLQRVFTAEPAMTSGNTAHDG